MLLSNLVKGLKKRLKEMPEQSGEKRVKGGAGLLPKLAEHLRDFVDKTSAARASYDEEHLKSLLEKLNRRDYTHYISRVGGIPHKIARIFVNVARAKNTHPYDLALKVARVAPKIAKRKQTRSAFDIASLLGLIYRMSGNKGDEGGGA